MLLYANSMTRLFLGGGLFQIPFPGSRTLLIGWKILLISLARYVFSGQSDTETKSFSRYGFARIWFQINHYCSLEKYAYLIHRQGATNYKIRF